MFVPKPTAQLAYVIGVESGDRFLNVKPKSYQYRVRLSAVDREFVEEFSHAVSGVLGCKPHSIWKGVTAREYQVEYGSFLLHKFLSKGFENLKRYIEHDRVCASAFIRGFFDSEGCMEKSGSLTASNSDLNLLFYVQRLHGEFFRIETTGPRLQTRKGSLLNKNGRTYVRRANCYVIYVKRTCLLKFHQEIGLAHLAETGKAGEDARIGLRIRRRGWDLNPRASTSALRESVTVAFGKL